MMHVFLEESPDPEALKKFVRRIAENTDIVYFSITPTQSVCRKCEWWAVGVYDSCPKCGGDTDIWSRVVGYYRPVRTWNPERVSDFRSRRIYRL